MPRRSTRIRDLQQRHSAVTGDGNGVNVETSSSNNERNVATNVYTNMDVEPVNNSPERIIVISCMYATVTPEWPVWKLPLSGTCFLQFNS